MPKFNTVHLVVAVIRAHRGNNFCKNYDLHVDVEFNSYGALNEIKWNNNHDIIITICSPISMS